jgi:maleylacetoacetate isomerase
MARAILHDYHRSSASYRVRIALNLKGIDYQRSPVNLLDREQKEAAYRKINPQGFVPTLEIDGHRITQSLAICNYINSIVPEPPFMPADAGDRAHVLAMALTIACDIHPLNNLRVLKYLSGPLAQSQEARDDWYAHWVTEGFEALEVMAKDRAGKFLFGDAPSLAEICLVPQMYNARRFSVPVDAYPTLLRADANACELPAFAAAHPEAQEVPA